MDRWTRLERGVAAVRDLRLLHDQGAGDLPECQSDSSASLSGVDARVRRSTRQCCRGVERMRVSRRAATFFPLATSYRFCGDRGPGRGVGGARRSLRHEGGGAGR